MNCLIYNTELYNKKLAVGPLSFLREKPYNYYYFHDFLLFGVAADTPVSVARCQQGEQTVAGWVSTFGILQTLCRHITSMMSLMLCRRWAISHAILFVYQKQHTSRFKVKIYLSHSHIFYRRSEKQRWYIYCRMN